MSSTPPSSASRIPFTPAKGGAQITYDAFKDRLTLLEWDALIALSKKIGEPPVMAALTSLDTPALREFSQKALVDQFQSKSSTPSIGYQGSRSLKLDTSEYKGTEGEAILRWFVEIEAAISARDITDPSRQVAYAMSRLANRAKSWAYGKRLADPNCFPDYNTFKKELRSAFEPPMTEFRTRTEFFNLSQGKRDILSYAQRARYLISCISEHPIDEHSQVVVFLKGLNDGPVRTELYRQFPATLEAAITLALQEDFSFKQAQFRTGSTPRAPGNPTGNPKTPSRKPPSTSAPEPMDLSSVSATTRPPHSGGRGKKPGNKKPVDKSTITCRRCWVKGHFPSECRAPAPVERPANITAPTPHKSGSKKP